jgi:serine/threonine protein kinase
VQFEAALMRDMLTGDRNTWIAKVLPVVLPGRSIEDIPVFLQPYSASRYLVDALTMDGIDELYRVLTGQPRHVAPELGRLVVRPPLAGSSSHALAADQPWHRGQEIVLGAESCLIMDVDGEEFGPDRSWVRRQALARRLASPAHLVVLRQVLALRSDESAEQQQAALIAEGTLLADMVDVTGMPRLLSQVSHRGGVTLVLSRPHARSLRDLYGPPLSTSDTTRRLEPTRTVGFLRTVYQMCRPLQALHQRRFSHRALTPDAVLLVDNGQTPTLRDIGLATIGPLPGEGIPPYQAPEQRHPGRHATVPGARTDVFQLAMIVHHTLTGDMPSGSLSPVGDGDPGLPPQLIELLADALSPVADHRPRDAAAFGISLTRVIDQIRPI